MGIYQLEVRAVSYSNPHHRAASGRCCERFGYTMNCAPGHCGYCDCDNRFFFCLRGPEADRGSNIGNCPLGSYSTGEIEMDVFDFDGSSLGNGVSNPMLFQGSVWPVSELHMWYSA